MYEGTYRIAEFRIRICSLHPDVQQYCKDYQTEEPPELILSVSQADIDYERRRSEHEDLVEGIPVRQFADGYLELLAVYRKIADYALSRRTLLFHGSAIAYRDRACLFTATSGTGKSTHTRLWRQLMGEQVYMVNDDKPLLKISSDGVRVCGTPWNGKHRLGRNCIVPLEAIVILRRGTANEIHEISASKALPMLMQQSYRSTDPALLPQTLALLDELTRHVKFYCLHCNMDPEAAQIAFDAVFGKGASV